MSFKRIQGRNFKSFEHFDVELGDFNVFVGANASGKSNFIQSIKFLRDLSKHGLKNALSMQGSIEYLRNINIQDREQFFLKYETDSTSRFSRGAYELDVLQTNYEIYTAGNSIENINIRDGYEIVADLYEMKLSPSKVYVRDKIASGPVSFNIRDQKIAGHADNDQLQYWSEFFVAISGQDVFYPVQDNNTLIFQTHTAYWDQFNRFVNTMSIYDFDPKLSKKSVPITGKAELEEDGSNVAIVLRDVMKNDKAYRSLQNCLNDIIPFAGDIRVDSFADKSLQFTLSESFNKNEFMPSQFLSEGTINIVAMILALFFEEKSLAIFEEPETHLHPRLISRLVDMMKEASKTKQIIVTTHNPEFVKHAGIENLFLVSRNKHGFSEISRPKDKKEIGVFLENELGLDELFIDGMLEI